MKLKKLLALTLTGVTLLSTVPVQAKTTNSIGYTNFMPLDDGGVTYMLNSDHVKVGSEYEYDSNLKQYVIERIPEQEINVPKNMWVSFDVINTTHSWTQEYEDRLNATDLDWFQEYVSDNIVHYSKEEDLKHNLKLPKDCTVTFTQNGKVIKQVKVDVDKILAHQSFKFYNKSSEPIIVSTSSDSWSICDVGYTAHKASTDITNMEWSFSFKKTKTFTATTSDIKDPETNKLAYVGVVTSDGKPVKAIIKKNGKVLAKRTIKSGCTEEFKMPSKGKYKVTIHSDSEFYNIKAKGNATINDSYLKSKLVIPTYYGKGSNRLYGDYITSSVKTNRRDMLIASSGKGNYEHVINNGGMRTESEIEKFNTFLESNNKADIFKVYSKVGNKKVKGSGWFYTVELKNGRISYDRLSW